MTTNTIKTVMVFLSVLSIAVPTAMAVPSERPSAERIDSALKQVQLYVEMDNQKTGTMDVKAAKENGVSEETLKIATKFLTA